MPLDALTQSVAETPLATLLAQLDIEPVAPATLAAHKHTQVQRFGPTFWYRHQKLLGFSLIVSVGCMAFFGGAANALMPPPSPVAMWITMGWLCLMAGLIVSGVFTARGGSHWEERWLHVDRLEAEGVPEPVSATARLLQRALPGSTVVIGELIRESVVLDPYLLLVRDKEQVCLGVWDDDVIVALAK